MGASSAAASSIQPVNGTIARSSRSTGKTRLEPATLVAAALAPPLSESGGMRRAFMPLRIPGRIAVHGGRPYVASNENTETGRRLLRPE
jgi:hypothetical protein